MDNSAPQEIQQFSNLQQKNKQKELQDGWWSSTANWMYLFVLKRKKKYFNGTHLLDLALNDQKSSQVWLFGRYFDKNQTAKLLYSSIIWFTYRENLRFTKICTQFTTKTDVGWGCMIRVGQMMLAHSLRMNKGIQNFNDQNQINKLLKDFIQQNGKYSIQRFCQKGYEIYQKKPGQWYSPSEIAYVIRDLQNENQQSNMKAIVYDNEFQLLKTIRFLDGQNYDKKWDRFQKEKKISSSINKEKVQLFSEKNIKIDPGLIIILFRIGLQSPQKNLLQSVIKILKNQKCCIGILGGRPGRAHYLVGTTQKSFIYLDPHCVKAEYNLDSFFCSNMFSIQHQKIDPSMGLCFYVRNTAQLMFLHERFETQTKNMPFYSYSNCLKPGIIQKQQTQEFQLLEFENDA